jgi:hypothetical protein
MAAKKKAKKRTGAKKIQARRTASKKSAKKPAAGRKKAAKSSSTMRRAAGRRNVSKKQAGTRSRQRDSVYSVTPKATMPSADEDSQGLSNAELADSESVGELLDEGNAFEAGVVSGVERADDADEREVRTREVPEDDVPEEYLDND